MKLINKFFGFIFLLTAFQVPNELVSEEWQSLGNDFGGGIGSFYCSSKDIMYVGGGGLVTYSTNKGTSWAEVSDPNATMMHLVVDIKEDNQGRIYCASGSGLFVSSDGLTNWSNLTGELTTQSISFDQLGNRYLVMDDNGKSKLLINNGTGTSWNNITPTGYTVSKLGCNIFENKILLTTGNDLLVSDDKGGTWTKAGATDDHFKFFRIVKAGGKYIALSGPSGMFNGMYESTDGLTWSLVNPSPSTFLFRWIKKDTYSDRLYGFCGNNEICASDDYGKTWVLANEGLPTMYYIYGIAFSADGNVYITCGDYNMYKRKFQTNSVEPVAINDNQLVIVNIGMDNFSIVPSKAEVRITNISVYNSLGIEIDRINGGNLGQGSYTVNTSEYSTGSYFILINSGKGSQIKKFTILR